MTAKPPHRDYSREKTNPGIARRMSESDGTVTLGEMETVDLTPVPVVAEQIIAAINDPPMTLSPEGRMMLEALSLEMAHRLAELNSRQLRAGESIPRRVHETEQAIKGLDVGKVNAEIAALVEWKGRMVGLNEGNGKMGGIEERIPATAAERAIEKAHHARFAWLFAKITASLLLVGGLTVGWVRHYAGSVRDEYDAAIVRRTKDEAWRTSTDDNIRRLFELFGLKRTP